MPATVILCSDPPAAPLAELLARYGLVLQWIDSNQPIPGSFWGDSEAGLLGDRLCVRPDTPLHSALHEAGHYICLDPERRRGLDTDAGGDYDEENAVCYLQILLAEQLPYVGSRRMMADMDAWGYSFRLGSARAWFEQDAGDALAWLQRFRIVDKRRHLTWTVRTDINIPALESK